METILSFIKSKNKQQDDPDMEDITEVEEVDEISHIEASQEMPELETPQEMPELEAPQEVPELETPKPKKVKKKRELSQKQRESLQKARLKKSELALKRKLVREEQKKEKERELQMRKEALILEKLQPMIDESIRRSLNNQFLQSAIKAPHPNSESVFDDFKNKSLKPEDESPPSPKPQVRKPQQLSEIEILRKAMGY